MLCPRDRVSNELDGGGTLRRTSVQLDFLQIFLLTVTGKCILSFVVLSGEPGCLIKFGYSGVHFDELVDASSGVAVIQVRSRQNSLGERGLLVSAVSGGMGMYNDVLKKKIWGTS